LPRHMEVALCGLGLIALAPLLLIIAALVKYTSPGPVLFRQRRMGQYGRPFELLKFRSMSDRPTGQGSLVTAGGDARITAVGCVLRSTKLDELPQLWNVVRGDMSLVGPRPEVPRYVQHYPELFGMVLKQRPGITDICTLQLRNEESILGGVEDPESYYIERLLPRKLAASIREGWKRNGWRDLRVLVGTVLPPLRALAPLPDFKPLAAVYRVTDEPLVMETAAARQAMAQGGAATPLLADVEPVRVEMGA